MCPFPSHIHKISYWLLQIKQHLFQNKYLSNQDLSLTSGLLMHEKSLIFNKMIKRNRKKVKSRSIEINQSRVFMLLVGMLA